MTTDKRTGWLRELKPGDLVFVPISHKPYLAIRRVTRITPAGSIYVAAVQEGSPVTKFSYLGRAGQGWDQRQLQQYTEVRGDRIRKENRRIRCIQALRQTTWERFDTETLVKADALITAALAKGNR